MLRSVRLRRTALVVRHLAAAYASGVVLVRRLGVPRDVLVAGLARQLLRSLDVRVTVRGTPRWGDEPLLVTANHVSWLDTYVLNAIAATRFVAKSEVASWPIAGSVAAAFDSIFIVRGSRRDAARVRHVVADVLRAGDAVGVFPEATTTDGTRVGPFHPALFQSAIDAGASVQPIAIGYLDSDGRPTSAPAFIDDMTFVESLRRIVAEPSLHAVVSCGPRLQTAGQSRKELAALARRWVVDTLGIESPEFAATSRAA